MDNIKLMIPELPEFKGEDSVKRWERAMEDIIIEMTLATDKRGLPILFNANDLISSFNDHTKVIRNSMNNDIGDGCTLVPRGY
jgi:hypothetical protein